MKTASIVLASLGFAAASVPAVADAQAWQTINARQANLYARIDQGIRSGALNRPEAARIKTTFRALADRESAYRRTGGLSTWERNDLNQRFNALSARVYTQKHDRQTHR